VLIRIDEHGSITLPVEIREMLGEAEILELVHRDDGVIELRPQDARLSSPDWFWSERWQRLEREADADIASGRVHRYENVEDFLQGLEAASTPRPSTDAE